MVSPAMQCVNMTVSATLTLLNRLHVGCSHHVLNIVVLYVCICRSASFDVRLMDQLAEKAKAMRKGSYMITLTRTLGSSHFDVLEKISRQMRWFVLLKGREGAVLCWRGCILCCVCIVGSDRGDDERVSSMVLYRMRLSLE